MTNFPITAFFLFVMRLFSCLILIAALSLNSFSQTINDTTFIGTSIVHGIKLYEDYIRGQELFYNGSAYLEPMRSNEQHAFFLSEEFMVGSITFDGHHFNNLPLLYDITSDQLITETSSASLLRLSREKLTHFNLAGNYFEKIDNRAVGNSLPIAGFYHVLYNGPTKVISLRQKTIQERIESGVLQIYFEERSRYFVLRNGRYYAVNGKASLLKLFKDQKNQVRAFIRKNQIHLKSDRDKAFSSVSMHYDTLTNK